MQFLPVVSGSEGVHSRVHSEGHSSQMSQRLSDTDCISIPPHPLGVKPSGNQYDATENARSHIGFLQSLPDEIIYMIIEWLDSEALLRLGSSCKALYAFCNSDELWRTLFLEYVFYRFFSSCVCLNCTVVVYIVF